MLQQILKDMYIDPDVLNALNEDQKKTLFLKMRQEQVRRWKEREDKLELEECGTKPRKANSKSVNWLLGRDGDVAVVVIGEMDELTSKFICSGMGEKKTPNLQSSAYHQTILKTRISVEPSRTESKTLSPKTQTGIALDFKDKCEETTNLRSLSVSLSEQSARAAGEKAEPQSLSASEEKSGVVPPSSCSRPPHRISPITARLQASANVTPGCVNTRSGLANPRLAADMLSSSLKDSEATSATTGSLNSQEQQKSLGSQGRKENAAIVSNEAVKPGPSNPAVAGRGRVAQLMKTFSVDGPSQTLPRGGVKPPLPTKPGHLRVTATPTVR
ncbi:SH2 domain-containing protein 4A [Gouania willdenowi]|uniref:SH2 domain-containing protein 4A-like n=1 Tax=Gouania willdenowi TaxID=441366 RepID=A0A8C5GVL0_GOUWI|nr:SH2 domain-containing protein 4A-like [Gouania willdenowi]